MQQYQKTPSLLQVLLGVCQEEAIQQAKWASPSPWPTLLIYHCKVEWFWLNRPIFIACRANSVPLSKSQCNAPGLLRLYNIWKILGRVFDKIFTFPKCREVVLPCSLQTSWHKRSLLGLAQFICSEPKKTEANIPPYSWNQQFIWLTIYSAAGMLEEAEFSSFSLGEIMFTWASWGCNLPLAQACSEITILLLFRKKLKWPLRVFMAFLAKDDAIIPHHSVMISIC